MGEKGNGGVGVREREKVKAATGQGEREGGQEEKGIGGGREGRRKRRTGGGRGREGSKKGRRRTEVENEGIHNHHEGNAYAAPLPDARVPSTRLRRAAVSGSRLQLRSS